MADAGTPARPGDTLDPMPSPTERHRRILAARIALAGLAAGLLVGGVTLSDGQPSRVSDNGSAAHSEIPRPHEGNDETKESLRMAANFTAASRPEAIFCAATFADTAARWRTPSRAQIHCAPIGDRRPQGTGAG